IAPTDLKSFCGEFINLVYSVSSQFMGAVATPEFLMYMDYFIRKDYGEDYIDHLDDIVDLTSKKRTLVKVIDNAFQQVVHSMNMPAGNRGYQTVFWNISYFDKPYFEGVFSDFRFPDGTAPKWETLSWLQKHFMQWFNEERNKYVLTFPVETMALLTDGGDEYADKEYADFTSEMWSKGHSFFCYISNSPDSLSSCCRLRNSLKDMQDASHNHTTHQYSMGTASVSTGSKSVMTINLNRVIQNAAREYFQQKGIELEPGKPLSPELKFDRKDLYKFINAQVSEMTERVHKYQTAFNEIIKDFLKADMLDVYKAGFIDMSRQYLTIGVNGMTDAAEFLGLQISPNEDYKEFVNGLLETINIANRKDKTKETMFNTEFVPGENLSGKNYKWDAKDGYFVSPRHNMYSSYFYNPEDESLSIVDKFKLHGEDYVKYLDGGSALHMNIAEHLTKEQYRQLLNVAAHYGTNYFTFNCRNTVCNDCGYISKDTLTECPKCGSKNLDYLTRVIGYLKRVSSFSEMRQVEAEHRFYIHEDKKETIA
ncbi:MAG: ribonucleoside-triphosphate reductase, partial [Bacteroidales bacterium]|nr:ribonucleoside-triphosphate reductase [Bacteroidales bacterium]